MMNVIKQNFSPTIRLSNNLRNIICILKNKYFIDILNRDKQSSFFLSLVINTYNYLKLSVYLILKFLLDTYFFMYK